MVKNGSFLLNPILDGLSARSYFRRGKNAPYLKVGRNMQMGYTSL